MASSVTLRKLVAPNLLTRSMTQLRSSSSSQGLNSGSCQSLIPYDSNHVVKVEMKCYNSPARNIANVFRTAYYNLIDLHPFSPIYNLAYALNLIMEVDPTARKWKVRQTAEALLLSCDDALGVKVSVERNSDIGNRPLNTPPHAGGTLLGVEYVMRHWGLRPRPRIYEMIVNQPALLVIERNRCEDKKIRTTLIDLPYNVFNTNAIKIEEQNQVLKVVLKVTIPKLKPECIDFVPSAPITVLAGFLNKMDAPPAHSRRWTVRQAAEMLLLDSFFPSAPITVLAGNLNKMDGLCLTAHRWTERQSAKMLPPGRWRVRQTADALLLHCDTSGVDVKVSVVPNSDIRNGPLNSTQPSGVSNFLGMSRSAINLLGTKMYQYIVNQPAVLKIESKSVKERENDEDIGYCTMLIDLPHNVYNTNAIKIEEENQVLKVTVPKLKSQWIGEVCFVYKEPKEECADMITLQGLKRLTWEPKYI